jgi:hypothetical protein
MIFEAKIVSLEVICNLNYDVCRDGVERGRKKLKVQSEKLKVERRREQDGEAEEEVHAFSFRFLSKRKILYV